MQDLKNKVYPQINEFSGINTGVSPFNIGDSESSDERNLWGEHFPSISQRMEREVFTDKCNLKEILHIGYLFDGDLFCVGKEQGKDYYGFYKYNTVGTKWDAFINTYIDGYHEYFTPTLFRREITFDKEHKVVSANWSGNKTVVSPGYIWRRTKNDTTTIKTDCIAYSIYKTEDKDNEGNIREIKYFCREVSGIRQTTESGADEIDVRKLVGAINFMQVKDNRLITGSKELPNMASTMYGEFSYRAADDTAIFEIATETGDNCTALAAFGDMILYFKRYSTYILYGKTPDSYYLDNLSGSVGCVAQGSIAEVGGGVMWLGADGVYAYSATTRPYKISQKVEKFIDNIDDEENACGVSDGRYYYLSVKQKNGEYVILVFDSERSVWHVWDGAPYKQMIHKNGEIFGFDGDTIYKLLTRPYTGAWHFISKPFDIGGISRKSNVHSLFINVTGKKGARLKVSISGDGEGDNFKTLFVMGFPTDKNEKKEIKIAPSNDTRNMKYLRLKFEGQGECLVHGIEVYMRVKGRTY